MAAICAVCQSLRILSFTVTTLPSPQLPLPHPPGNSRGPLAQALVGPCRRESVQTGGCPSPCKFSSFTLESVSYSTAALPRVQVY